MTYKFVTIESSGSIKIVHFDRGMKANPLSFEMLRELTELARSFEGDIETSVVILTGRSDNFSLGMDLKDPGLPQLQDMGLMEKREFLAAGSRCCAAWEAIEAMTISAVEGWCVGGGVALAVSTDLRVAARNATLYVPEIERGMNMSWGSVPRIANLVGPARAKRLVVVAEKITAPIAENWGLVDYVSDDGKSVEKALEIANRVAEMPPVAARMCKQAIDATAKALNSATSIMDRDQFILTTTSEDYLEGVQSFIEGRSPEFSGK